MKTLETYLEAVDRYLGPVAMEVRAEVLARVKEEYLGLRDGGLDEESALEALGHPSDKAKALANKAKARQGRGRNEGRGVRLFLWILGAFTLLTGALILYAVVRFTPLYAEDPDTKQIQLLGGLVKLDQTRGIILLNDKEVGRGMGGFRVRGSRALPDSENRIEIRFLNGVVRIEPSDDRTLTWDCRSNSPGIPLNTNREGSSWRLDLSKAAGMECEIEIPDRSVLKISGANGKITLERPRFEAEITLTNGVVGILPSHQPGNRFDLSVASGVVDNFLDSDKTGSNLIKVAVGNGRIERIK